MAGLCPLSPLSLSCSFSFSSNCLLLLPLPLFTHFPLPKPGKGRQASAYFSQFSFSFSFHSCYRSSSFDSVHRELLRDFLILRGILTRIFGLIAKLYTGTGSGVW